MTQEARALARALLDHRRKVRRSPGSEDVNIEPYLIAYGELCERAGVSDLKPRPGRYLREVAQWCDENGWPPLNALAVNHATRRPGHGYDSAPGCSLAGWPDQVKACVEFSGYPQAVP